MIQGLSSIAAATVATTSEDPWWWRDVFWSFINVILVLVAAFGAWWLTTRKRNRVATLLDRIDRIHASGMQTPHTIEKEFLTFKSIVATELKKGSIDESSYLILDKRIDDYVKEAREMIIEERFSTLPSTLKDELKLMIDDGKVTEGEVITFEKVLSSSTVSERDKGELRSLVSEWQTRKGGIPTHATRQEHRSRAPKILSHIKKSLSLGPVVVGRRKKT